ncbi:hypothetical protein [Polaromonas sp.]|uniref:hypothetical protein n=1 Tax=Polaromonas sp. TaxID=1869339 RepID=UPI0025DC6466|nr:hypothetical protein [Polaromonas sp.]
MSGFADFESGLCTGASLVLYLGDMAGFPDFSSFAFPGGGWVATFTTVLVKAFAAGLAVGLRAVLTEDRVPALAAVVAFGFTVAFGNLPGCVAGLDFAKGMKPPVVGKTAKYRSITSQQKCACACA